MTQKLRPRSLLVLGGSSDIGRATALRFAEADWRICLAGRDLEALRREADDIATRTDVTVSVHALDILDETHFESFIDNLPFLPDAILCVIGLLGTQRLAEIDLAHASTVFRSNLEGPALMLGLFAERLAARGYGTIIGVSSVAGERGRAANYVYGAAKAGFTAFLSGLRNRFGKTPIRVVTVLPGFVRTRMTKEMELPGPLTADPEEVARAIFRAVMPKPREVIYVKPIWRIVMAVIRAIPERIFMKLRI
ncbi:MAG: SDR family oxidoreductase [Acidobacteriaceae bacterium]|nr:SDR family oxidoreductase [Acidobacteriaceae bacterium]